MAIRVILASASPARLKTLQNAGVFPEVIVSQVDERAAVAQAETENGPLAPAEQALLLARLKANAVAAQLVWDSVFPNSSAPRIAQSPTPPSSCAQSQHPETPAPSCCAQSQHPETTAPSCCAQSQHPETAAPSCYAQSQHPETTLDSATYAQNDKNIHAQNLQDATLVIGCDSVFEFEGQPYGRPPNAETAIARIMQMQGKTGTLHTGHRVMLITGNPVTTTPAEAIGSSIVHFGNMDDAEIAAYVATGEPLNVAGSFTVDGLGGPFIESIEGDYHNVVGISLPLLRHLVGELGINWRDVRSTNCAG